MSFPPYPPQPLSEFPATPDSSPSHFQTQQYTPSAITAAWPPVVTIANNGFVTGQALRATKFVRIPFAVATGMEQLNNRVWYVGQIYDANSFALYDVYGYPIDGRGFTPYIQGGQFTRTGPDLGVVNPSPDPPPGTVP